MYWFVGISRQAKKRQARYANKNSEYTEFQVGDPVYLKQQLKIANLRGGAVHIIEKKHHFVHCTAIISQLHLSMTFSV